MPKDIADYDKYKYNYEKYWQDSEVKRDYEDQAERIAIRKLLNFIGCPTSKKEVGHPSSGWLCDLGAGFGRLYDIYANRFRNTILTDYSLENLKKAQKNIKAISYKLKANTYFVALNAYRLPFRDNSLDCLLAVRLLHHIEDPGAVMKEMSRVLRPGGKLILEYPNKRHFLEIIKALVGKSKMKPFSLEPTERGEGPFYNFHPKYINDKVQSSKFKVQKILSVSNLRHRIFKKILGTKLMLLSDTLLSPIFNLLKFGPSIFILAEKKANQKQLITQLLNYPITDILICPSCHSDKLKSFNKKIECQNCRKDYKIIDDIYDFRV